MEINKEELQSMSMADLCALSLYLKQNNGYHNARGGDYFDEYHIVRQEIENRLKNLFIY
jgi:hypothetical protein